MIAGKQIKEIKWEFLNTWIIILKQRGKKEKKGHKQIENKDQTKHIIKLSMYSLNT